MWYFVSHAVYSVIQLRYFQWKYFLNNFSLLDGFLRPVCLLTVRSNFIMIYRPVSRMLGSYIFWWHMFFKNSFHIASHKAPINCFFWTSFLFLQAFLHISSISFCCDSWIICHLLHTSWLTCFCVSWSHFLCFFGCCECWLPLISRVMCHTRPE